MNDEKKIKDFGVEEGQIVYLTECLFNRRNSDGTPVNSSPHRAKVVKVGRRYITVIKLDSNDNPTGWETRYSYPITGSDVHNWLCAADTANSIDSSKKLFRTQSEADDFLEAVRLCKELHGLFNSIVCTNPPFTAAQLRKVTDILNE